MKQKWTAEEEELLCLYYGRISAREISNQILQDRTREAIKLHAKLLGLDGNAEVLNKRYHTKYDENTKEKICTICGVLKSIDGFYNHKRKEKIRRESACIDCMNEAHRKKYANSVAFRERLKSGHQKQREKMRSLIIENYGGKCSCPKCPETNPLFLTIEHIDGGGTKHRKTRGELGVYRDIINQGFPASYTILCYNCNCAKAHSRDNVCPHLI